MGASYREGGYALLMSKKKKKKKIQDIGILDISDVENKLRGTHEPGGCDMQGTRLNVTRHVVIM